MYEKQIKRTVFFIMKIQRIENPISDDLFLEWHDAKNGELTPYMVSAHSDRKVWWKGKCGHE